MSAFAFGDRYNWCGEKHGPWRRGTGGLRNRPTERLPLRFREVRDLARLLQDPIACAVWVRWTK